MHEYIVPKENINPITHVYNLKFKEKIYSPDRTSVSYPNKKSWSQVFSPIAVFTASSLRTDLLHF